MKPEIIWSKDAGDELAEIISYIKNNTGKMTAQKIYTKIISKINQASKNPEGRRNLEEILYTKIMDGKIT